VNAVAGDLAAQGLGDKKVTFRLRDWGISRQRYWGTPIPMIHCADCGVVPVPEADLPVVLPEHLVPDGTGNPLNKDEAFLKCDCPKCGKPARRETDTMDTFIDSSWYYMRYTSPGSNDAMVDARNDYWMPMDQYIGGIEHAVMHLLYARFWTKVMRDFGLVKFDEPFVNLLTQGMVLNETYYREDTLGQEDLVQPGRRRTDLRRQGPSAERGAEGRRPAGHHRRHREDVEVEEQRHRPAGADRAVRRRHRAPVHDVRLAAGADPGVVDSGVEGASRFLRRVWAYAYAQSRAHRRRAGRPMPQASFDEAHKTLRREVHKILQQADYDLKRIQYNTVVSACMKMLNTMESAKLADGIRGSGDAVIAEGLSIFLRVLNPVAPHITHALWQELGYAKVHGDILDVQWPQVDPAALEQAEIEMMIQVNGKLRGSVKVAKDADKAAIEAAALASEAVQKFIEGAPKKVIVVPGKLVNIVV
jgi:leucyl-tRNA synthetase